MMKYLGRNEELINNLSGDLSLLSAKLYRIDIHSDSSSELIIELYVELLYAKADKRIKLIFSEIEEFSFYHNRAHYFYNIEEYKFLKKGDSFYISLDPYTEEVTSSLKDQDFILSNIVEGYFV